MAPSRALLGVPSSVDHRLVDASPGRRRRGRESASKISPFTASTAFSTPLPPIALLVAVAQLDRLVRAGGGAGRHGGAADGAALQRDIDLDGRIAAAVQDLPRVDVDDARSCPCSAEAIGLAARYIAGGTIGSRENRRRRVRAQLDPSWISGCLRRSGSSRLRSAAARSVMTSAGLLRAVLDVAPRLSCSALTSSFRVTAVEVARQHPAVGCRS